MARRKADLAVVGRDQPRLDGADKLTGRSLFTDDVVLPGMLVGKVVRSPHARARILSIDTSAARALPGVKAVITHAEAAKVVIGINQPLFRSDTVNYIGDEVAAVAAVDEATAARAAALVRVEYEPLPPLPTIDAALADGAPILHAKAEGNLAWQSAEDRGDPDAGFGAAATIREDTYTTHASHNCYAEFHAVVADWSRPERLTVWTPTQTALLYQKSIARSLGLTDGAVRLMTLNTGGGFTGRTSARPHHFVAALLSRQAGRPVKIRASADEEFIVCRAGGEVRYRYRTGVDADGRILAFEADLLFDTGAYVETQMIVTTLTAAYIHTLYKVDATRYRGRLVHTNNIPYYFHHGGGIAQMAFGLGLHMDALARQLGMDPVDFHLKNMVTEGHTSLTGTYFASCGLGECIRRATKQAGWKRKYGRQKPLRGIGLGIGAMASGAKGVFRHDTSAAFIKVMDDGTMTLFVGLPDMGQSSHTAMAIIAAEVLGAEVADITVVSGDTDITPLDVGAFTQRGTFNTGNAVKAAALDARRQLEVTAAAQLDCRRSQLVFRGREVCSQAAPDRRVPLKKIIYDTLHSREGRFVMGRGFYNSPKESGTMAYSFGAQVAEVSIDPDSGVITVERVVVAHDVGRAINPRIVEGQMDGQVFSGMSQVLYEETLLEDGQVLNPSRLDYKMPRSYEMPRVEHIIVESIDPFGPFGAKEVGEGPIVCTVPAIANAVANALGVPVTEMPIAPWKVLRLLGRRGGKGG
ncbi:MAG: molybdopterin-dependent oxidoreductase [Chromatiales bacterium]|jgi:4-hydroxybenzoyl-CoA reductase subunit alpha|nr:molybdopterin-dependent oxidoreductase [Chromatiales bacterium]